MMKFFLSGAIESDKSGGDLSADVNGRLQFWDSCLAKHEEWTRQNMKNHFYAQKKFAWMQMTNI